MHRDVAHHLVLLALTCLLVSAAQPAPLPAGSLRALSPPVLLHRDNDDRRPCRHTTRSRSLAAPVPRSQPGPGPITAALTLSGRRAARAGP